MITELFASAPENLADPLLEQLRRATLGIYDIAGELGRGGMATVFLARDMRLGRKVAIKVMDPLVSLKSGMTQRFLKEAQSLAKLEHPNIVRVYDWKQSHGISYFVMNFVDGGGLDELCGLGRTIPIDQIQWILLHASRALAHGHTLDERVIHRDVKPANILLDTKGNVVLTDFGIAKSVGVSGQTGPGTQIGTPSYMSPEQFGNGLLGPASDQYSLGVTAYELISGRKPFIGEFYQLIAAHSGQRPTPLTDLRPDCPADLASAVMRMLEKEPARRWPSLDSLEQVFAANLPPDGGSVRRSVATVALELSENRRNLGPRDDTPITGQPNLFVTISPPAATIIVGNVLSLNARVTLDSGEVRSGCTIRWSTSNAECATIAPDGLLKAIAPGTVVIRATVGTSWEEATIQVSPAAIVRLTVTLPRPTLHVGDFVAPTVIAIDANGVSRTDASLQWICRTPSIAQLSAPGNIVAVSPGNAIIEVHCGKVSRTFELNVTGRPIASLRVRKPLQRFEVGDAFALTVDVLDDLGNVVQRPSVQWFSSLPSAIVVDASGTILAMGPGSARITARIDDISDSIELESVEGTIEKLELQLDPAYAEVGETVAIVLRAFDPGGNARSLRGVRVWSANSAVAEVDTATLQVKTSAVGATSIHAESGGTDSTSIRTASATIVVRESAVSRIQVSPSNLEMETGALAQVTAHCFDRHGRALNNRVPSFVSTDSGIFTVDSAGSVRAHAVGTAALRAWIVNPDQSRIETTASVAVFRARVARLQISTDNPVLNIGDSAVIPALVLDAFGEPISDVRIRWVSSEPSIAHIDIDGRVSALTAGRTRITAQVDDVIDEVGLLVRSVPLESFTLRPQPEALVGVAVQLSATAVDVHGENITPVLRWAVDPPSAARISASGQFTALQTGTCKVHATIVDELSTHSYVADISIAVRLPAIEGVRVDRNSVTVAVGQRKQLSGQVYFEANADAPQPVLVWATENPAIARISSSGELEGLGVGNTEVRATADGRDARVAVNVTATRHIFGFPSRLVFAGLSVLTAAVAVAVTVNRTSETDSTGSVTSTDSTVPGTKKSNSVPNAVRSDSTIRNTRRADSTQSVEAPALAKKRELPLPTLSRSPTVPPLASNADAQNEQVRQRRRQDSVIAKSKSDSIRDAAASLAIASARAESISNELNRRAESARAAEAPRSARGVVPSVSAPLTHAVSAPSFQDAQSFITVLVRDVANGTRGSDELKKYLNGVSNQVSFVDGSAREVSRDGATIRVQFQLRLKKVFGSGNEETRFVVVDFAATDNPPRLGSVNFSSPQKRN